MNKIKLQSLVKFRLQCFYLLLMFSLLNIQAQSKYEDNANWLVKIIESDTKLEYNIDGIIDVKRTRTLSIEEGWVEFVEIDEKRKMDIIRFHLKDLDPESIKLRVRDDVDKNQTLYQFSIHTVEREELIKELKWIGNSQESYFALYFTKASFQNDFKYALVQAITSSPDKVERIVPISEGSMVRNLDWGMNTAQVMSLQKGQPVDGIYDLTYLEEVDGEKLILSYSFESDKLNVILMEYLLEFEDQQEYLTKYKELTSIYESKYGKPVSYIEDWRDLSDYLKGQKEKYGYAIANERLLIRTIFEDDHSKIIFNIMGRDGIPQISVYRKAK